MKKYYYFTGHDSNNTKRPEAFIEYDSVQALADEHYEGDLDAALKDNEYVFSDEEYEDWIK